MCAIAGALKTDKTTNILVKKMLKLMHHRGPDETGIYESDDFLSIGMNRLAITGVKDVGYVPFVYNEFILSFNGEIYNFKEIRKHLQIKYRLKFQTNTDSEVLIKLWSIYGPDSLSKLNGMYAFSIYNTKEKRLFLVRDIAGQKPLYYYKKGNEFAFASEAKALYYSIKNLSLVNIKNLRFYEAFQHTLEKTLFNNIYQVPAAHYLEIDLKTTKIKKIRYWQPNFIENKNSESDILEEFEFLLKQSINEIVSTEVPYGIYLSKGIDSQTINEFHQFKNSYFFNRNKNWSRDFYNKIKDVVKTIDFPVGSLSSYPLYKLAEMASKEVKVIVSGEGADELLGGYVRYMPSIQSNELFNKFPTYHPLFNKGLTDGYDIFSKLTCRNEDTSYITDLVKKTQSETPDLLTCMQYFDFKYILPSLLQMGDRCASKFSLENRCPFLSKNIINFCFNLPYKYKIKGFSQKNILRNLAKKLNFQTESEKTGLTIKFNNYLHRNDFNRDSYFSIINYIWLSQFRDANKVD